MRIFGRLAQCLLVLSIPFLYLFFAVSTLSDYGINWDEPYHFHRGQAYLHYLATGRTDFGDLPAYPNLTPECEGEACDGGPEGPTDRLEFAGTPIIYEDAVRERQVRSARRRSAFQANVYDFSYFIEQDKIGGHPPASDILAAFTNYIFYQRLGILGDVEAHHLFEVIAVFLLVVGVAVFTYLNFGTLVSVVASATLASYPLVFSESHFNIKDPPEAAFFGLAVILFYFGVVGTKWYFLILSAASAGLALGTKFNVVFLPFVLIPWLGVYIVTNRRKRLTDWRVLTEAGGLIATYVIVALLVFYIFWPYLWGNPIGNLAPTVEFYRQSGTTLLPELRGFVYGGFNLFPVTWIAITTPLPVLLLGIFGLAFSIIKLVRGKQFVYLLILLWFFIPIIRVSLPGTAIHSGVRHIMEFVPAISILAGLGALTLFKMARRKVAKTLVLGAIALFLGFAVWEVARLYPNENVYFNQLVGGLPGARRRNIPYWGYSYGNVYLQGVQWLNKNAEPDSKLTLLVGTMSNVPWSKLRADIQYHNRYWSGPKKAGEYAMEMTHNNFPRELYRFAYYEKFLIPVHEVKVDGVTILKIWENDLAHTRPGFETEVVYTPVSVKPNGDKLEIDLGRKVALTRLVVEHGKTGCQKQRGGFIITSIEGAQWKREVEAIDLPQSPSEGLAEEMIGFDEDTFVFLFPAREARYIRVVTDIENSCYLKNPNVSVYALEQK